MTLGYCFFQPNQLFDEEKVFWLLLLHLPRISGLPAVAALLTKHICLMRLLAKDEFSMLNSFKCLRLLLFINAFAVATAATFLTTHPYFDKCEDTPVPFYVISCSLIVYPEVH